MTKYAKRTGTRWFASIDERAVKASWFLTLTWPSDEAKDVQTFKKGMERYFARLLRAFGDRVAWYWAIEPHSSPRAAGRFHAHVILLWVGNPPALDAFRAWNDSAWWTSTRCQHESGGKYACRVEVARSWKGVRSYLCGYLAPEKWEAYEGGLTGRVHGVRNRHLVPIRRDEIELTPQALRLLRRACRRRDEALSRHGVTLTDADGKARRLRDLSSLRMIQPGQYRDAVKRLSAVAMRDGLRLRRSRRKFMRIERCDREWDTEEIVMPSGRVVRRDVPREFDLDDGGPLRPVSIGRSVVCGIPEEVADRLVQWAAREDMRREEFERACPV